MVTVVVLMLMTMALLLMMIHDHHDDGVAEAVPGVVCSVVLSLLDVMSFVLLFGVVFAAVAPRDC